MTASLYDFPRQKTTRAYLHPTFSTRMVLFMRDFKLCNLELNPRPHFGQKGAALLLLGEDSEPLPFRESVFDPVAGGLPRYTLRTAAKNGGAVSLTAFCDHDKNPTVYFEIKIKNPKAAALSGSLSLLPVTAEDDRYLTGLWDTGYMAYDPNPRSWTMLDSGYAYENGVLSDGYAAAVLESGVPLVFHGAEPDNFAFSRYVTLPYSLAPGEEITLRGRWAVGKIPTEGPSFSEAEAAFREGWQAIQKKITRFPKDQAKNRELYLAQVTLCLQMLATYSDGWVYPRQGCVGRFVWAWEAAYYLTALDRIGLWEYTRPAHEMLLTRWMVTDPTADNAGLIANPDVDWANTNGSVIWCVSAHLRAHRDEALLARWMPYLKRAVTYIEKRRHSTPPGQVPGLFPAAVASDWPEVGQHYTYTDSVNVMGYRELAAMLGEYAHPEADRYRELYEDYHAVLCRAMDRLIEGHDPAEDYMPTHILGTDFKDVRTHCYTTDGTVYLPMCGNLSPDSPFFGFVERYYERHGLTGPLRARITNLDFGDPSVYGDCYYTGVAEIAWFYAYLIRGDRDRAREMLESVLYFNLTDEHIAAERWTPKTAWYAPWQPNASAAGRIISALLDWYGEEEPEKTEKNL